LAIFQRLDEDWGDARQEARYLPTASLVEKMQTLRDNARKAELGECFAEAKRLEISEMDAAISDAIQRLSSGGGTTEESEEIKEAKRKKTEAVDLIREKFEPEAVALDIAERKALAEEVEAHKEAAAKQAALEAARKEEEARQAEARRVEQSAAAEAEIQKVLEAQYQQLSRDREAKAREWSREFKGRPLITQRPRSTPPQ